jgi:hypothetical protein
MPNKNTIPPDSFGRFADINYMVTDTIEIRDSVSFFGSEYITGPEVVDYTNISIVDYFKKIGLVTTDYFNNLQAGPLTGTGTSIGAQQGFSSSISSDGNTCITGGFANKINGLTIGAAWIYTRTGTKWSQQGSIIIPADIVSTSNFGFGVDISADGNTVAIGAPYINSSQVGATYIYILTGGIWTQQDKLVGTGGIGIQSQGISVALSADGNTVAIGGYSDNSGVGSTWVFTRTGNVWTQQGLKLVGTGGTTSQQGFSVSLSDDGNTLVIGAPGINAGIGGFWVFTRTTGTWTQKAGPISGTENAGDSQQGKNNSISISGDGNTIAIGGRANNNSIGGVWVFVRSINEWTQQIGPIIPSDLKGNGEIGYSVSLTYDGNTLIFGGPSAIPTSSIWVYSRSSGVWSQSSKISLSLSNSNTQFGISSAVSSDGTTLVGGGIKFLDITGAIWIFVV